MNKKITVLHPIKVPEGDYCSTIGKETNACVFYNSEFGLNSCDLDFRPLLETNAGVKKAPVCAELQTKAKVVVEVLGGVASVEESPDWVEVEIKDYDTDEEE